MCPDNETLSAYFDNEIPSPWNKRIADHIAECASCQKRLRQFETIKNYLHEDREPSFESSLEQLEIRLAGLKPRTERVSLWKRRVAVPLPAAVIAAICIMILGISLIFSLTRSNLRTMSIRRGPSGTTEVQVAAPIEDLELLLKSLDTYYLKQEIIITLPEDSLFNITGEAMMFREAEFSRKRE